MFESATLNRALTRLKRAWAEADHLLSSLPEKKIDKLQSLQGKKSRRSVTMAQLLRPAVEVSCGSCGRCCSKAAMDSGYFSHAERQGLLSINVDIETYMVADWEGQPPERCLFLSPTGCNIPDTLRSAQCLSYVCYDVLGPQLVKLDLEESFRRQQNKLSKSKTKMGQVGKVSFSHIAAPLGDG